MNEQADYETNIRLAIGCIVDSVSAFLVFASQLSPMFGLLVPGKTTLALIRE